MKLFFLNPKSAVAAVVFAITLLAVGHEAKSALIDWAKHEEWRRKQLEALVAEVKLQGSAPYVIMSFRNYDTNDDGVIDADESEIIQSYLKQLPATRPKK